MEGGGVFEDLKLKNKLICLKNQIKNFDTLNPHRHWYTERVKKLDFFKFTNNYDISPPFRTLLQSLHEVPIPPHTPHSSSSLKYIFIIHLIPYSIYSLFIEFLEVFIHDSSSSLKHIFITLLVPYSIYSWFI